MNPFIPVRIIDTFSFLQSDPHFALRSRVACVYATDNTRRACRCEGVSLVAGIDGTMLAMFYALKFTLENILDFFFFFSTAFNKELIKILRPLKAANRSSTLLRLYR